MKVLVTAGPTREFIDDVRFLSNRSSGKMGFAIAEASAKAGCDVTLIAGPVALPSPAGVKRVDVISAEDMRSETLKLFEDCDCLVMVAAVCDFRPIPVDRPVSGKIKKSAGEFLVRMVSNPDILAELGANKGDKKLIGFALESPPDRNEAMRKLRDKNLDAIVLNSPAAFETDRSSVEIFQADGESISIKDADKSDIAEALVQLILSDKINSCGDSSVCCAATDIGDIVVEFKRKPEAADVPLPKYMSDRASGMDVCAAVDDPVEMKPGEIKLIPTGISIAVPPGFEAQVRPRSGLALKHGITVVNAPGTIDSDYRGEVGIILGNIGREAFTIERGMRIAQIVIQKVERARLIQRDELTETDRSGGGFGHTGV